MEELPDISEQISQAMQHFIKLKQEGNSLELISPISVGEMVHDWLRIQEQEAIRLVALQQSA